MRSHRKLSLVLSLALLLGSSACKKTVEGETKSWESRSRRVTALKAVYPAFAAPLDEQTREAEAIFAAARQLGDPKAQAEKMAEANKLLTAGIVETLERFDTASKRMRSKAMELINGATDEADRTAARFAADDLQRVLASGEARLRAGAGDLASARTVIGRVLDELNAVDRTLADVDRNIRRKRNAAEEARQAAAGAAAPVAAPAAGPAAGAAAAPRPIVWKCPYCGKSNPDDAHACASCGAPRK